MDVVDGEMEWVVVVERGLVVVEVVVVVEEPIDGLGRLVEVESGRWWAGVETIVVDLKVVGCAKVEVEWVVDV